LVVPAADVIGGLFLAWGLWPASARVLIPATIGALFAAVVVPHVDRALRVPVWLYLLMAAVVAVAGAVLFVRSAVARAFGTATSVGPIVFLVLFLLVSPASALVFPEQVTGAVTVERPKNVLIVVFDELPLGALLNEQGAIDPVRYPGFARLASESTWYRNATTISVWTHVAVPAMLTGLVPSENLAPVEANHPRNLFRLLATTHKPRAEEVITRLCPEDRCSRGARMDRGLLYRDAATVFLHGLLPDELATRWLPPTADRWAGFEGDPDDGDPSRPDDEASIEEEAFDPRARFRAMLEDVERGPGSRPSLWFGHFLLPHFPLWYLPTGDRYDNRPGRPPSFRDIPSESTDRPFVREYSRQRFVLQLKFVDLLVRELLDTLHSSGRADDTLLVVAADHGISFTGGDRHHRRGLPITDRTRDEVLPVPLFVRYPGEPGRIDDQPRQILDIAPTIAAELGAELPPGWRFDGHSLRDPLGHDERRFVDHRVDDLPNRVDLATAARPYLDMFGEGQRVHDVYTWGPHRALVGQRPPEAARASEPAHTVRLRTPGLVTRDSTSEITPALILLDFGETESPGEWVAVAVNGAIAGVGPVWEFRERYHGEAIIDPVYLRDGDNRIQVFVVGDDGRLARARVRS
jgi:arylsulfatase A-like enzyme